MTGKALCEHLKKYHRGQENAASSRELEAAFHIKGTELRRAVNRLRCGGNPICSDETGLWDPRKIEDFVGRGAIAERANFHARTEASDTELMATNAVRQSEIRATIAQLTGRISKIAAAKNGLLKSQEKEG